MENKIKNPKESSLSRIDYGIRYQYLVKDLPNERADIIFATQNRSNIPGSTPRVASPGVQALKLVFSDIAQVDTVVGDSANVSDWNTYFDLPTYGSPFTSVTVVGNEVQLFGASNITTKESLFDQIDELGSYLLEVNDEAGCVTQINYSSFGADNFIGCQNLTSAYFPNVTTMQDWCFYNCNSLTDIQIPQLTSGNVGCFYDCISLTNVSFPQLSNIGGSFFFNCSSLITINIPACTILGGPPSDLNNVFFNISGNTITLTIPSAIMTSNAGNPDADAQYLIDNNTVTVVTV